MKLSRHIMSALCVSGVLQACREMPPPGATDPADPGQSANFADAGETPLDTPGPQPIVARRSPPPISGGTLAVDRSRRLIAASDPDRDRVVIVDFEGGGLVEVPLEEGDEPGRLVFDAAGQLHVALRAAGAVAVIDPGAEGTLLERRSLCAAPRGLAVDGDRLHVACAGGELVTLVAASGELLRSRALGPDLRDVLVVGGRLLLSRFRSAEVFSISTDGESDDTETPSGRAPPALTSGGDRFKADVAWRLVPRPGGTGGLLLHQRAQESRLSDQRTGVSYSNGPCASGVVHAVASYVGEGAPDAPAPMLTRLVLPVDGAFSDDGGRLAVVSAGGTFLRSGEPEAETQKLRIFDVTHSSQPVVDIDGCGSLLGWSPRPGEAADDGQLIAVAWLSNQHLVMQSREPSRLLFAKVRAVDGETRVEIERRVDLGGESVRDTGHDLFHFSASGSTACASCHPEGGDDGHVWDLADGGRRRTQSLRGGLLQTAPFHWDGKLGDVPALVREVFNTRMAGPEVGHDEARAIGDWMEHLAPLPSPIAGIDGVAISRGKALFHDTEIGCADCHAGGHFTDNEAYDVGTGGKLQVPSLVGLHYRAPYLRSGCATTLRDRFGPCGGGDAHGKTSRLSAADVDDLVAYLESL